MDSRLSRFKQICAEVRLQTSNCEKSQNRFAEAASVTETVAAFRMFWISAVEQAPAPLLAALNQHYDEFRDEINAAGVFFNEAPSNPLNAVVFVGDLITPLKIVEGRPRVIVLGNANVTIADHVRCECHHDAAIVECYGHSSLRLEKGYAIANEYSTVQGSGTVFTQQFATAYLNSGTLFDHGHKLIKAYNDATIYSFTHRKIELFDHSQLKDINE